MAAGFGDDRRGISGWRGYPGGGHHVRVKIANYSAMLAADPRGLRDRRLDVFDDDDGYGGGAGRIGRQIRGIKPGDPDYREREDKEPRTK